MVADMKQIAVLGLSRFGASVAVSLVKNGVEVLGVDNDPDKVAEMVHDLTHVIQADILDPDALDSLGLRNFDAVVLSIKEMETSCLATMALKDHGAKYVVAQAGGDAHATILQRIGADKVICPEKDMGIRLARNMAGNNIVDYMELTNRHSLMELEALDEWVGHTPAGEQHPHPLRAQCGGDPFREKYAGIPAGHRFDPRRRSSGGDRGKRRPRKTQPAGGEKK